MDLEMTQVLSVEESDDDEDANPGKAHLRVTSEDGQEKDFQLKPGENTVGREMSCDIFINDKSISKRHAVILLSKKYTCIWDLGSVNKTKKGKITLPPNVRYGLELNEKFTLGNVQAQIVNIHTTDESDSETCSESMLLNGDEEQNEKNDSKDDCDSQVSTLDCQANCDNLELLPHTNKDHALPQNNNNDDDTDVEQSASSKPAECLFSDDGGFSVPPLPDLNFTQKEEENFLNAETQALETQKVLELSDVQPPINFYTEPTQPLPEDDDDDDHCRFLNAPTQALPECEDMDDLDATQDMNSFVQEASKANVSESGDKNDDILCAATQSCRDVEDDVVFCPSTQQDSTFGFNKTVTEAPTMCIGEVPSSPLSIAETPPPESPLAKDVISESEAEDQEQHELLKPDKDANETLPFLPESEVFEPLADIPERSSTIESSKEKDKSTFSAVQSKTEKILDQASAVTIASEYQKSVQVHEEVSLSKHSSEHFKKLDCMRKKEMEQEDTSNCKNESSSSASPCVQDPKITPATPESTNTKVHVRLSRKKKAQPSVEKNNKPDHALNNKIVEKEICNSESDSFKDAERDLKFESLMPHKQPVVKLVKTDQNSTPVENYNIKCAKENKMSSKRGRSKKIKVTSDEEAVEKSNESDKEKEQMLLSRKKECDPDISEDGFKRTVPSLRIRLNRKQKILIEKTTEDDVMSSESASEMGEQLKTKSTIVERKSAKEKEQNNTAEQSELPLSKRSRRKTRQKKNMEEDCEQNEALSESEKRQSTKDDVLQEDIKENENHTGHVRKNAKQSPSKNSETENKRLDACNQKEEIASSNLTSKDVKETPQKRLARRGRSNKGNSDNCLLPKESEDNQRQEDTVEKRKQSKKKEKLDQKGTKKFDKEEVGSLSEEENEVLQQEEVIVEKRKTKKKVHEEKMDKSKQNSDTNEVTPYANRRKRASRNNMPESESPRKSRRLQNIVLEKEVSENCSKLKPKGRSRKVDQTTSEIVTLSKEAPKEKTPSANEISDIHESNQPDISDNKVIPQSPRKGRRGKTAEASESVEKIKSTPKSSRPKRKPTADSENEVEEKISRRVAVPEVRTIPRRRNADSLNSSFSSVASGISDSPSRSSKRATKASLKIMVTGLEEFDKDKLIVRLGGKVVEEPTECTHLVTDKMRRTVKALCCVAQGIPLISLKWLEECESAGKFIDHTPFLIKDTAAEKQYQFCLKKTLQEASQEPLLKGWSIAITSKVLPKPAQMKEIITAAGGKFLSKVPSRYQERAIVITCPEEKKLCQQASKAGIPIVSNEFLLTGLLQYKLDFKKFAIK